MAASGDLAKTLQNHTGQRYCRRYARPGPDCMRIPVLSTSAALSNDVAAQRTLLYRQCETLLHWTGGAAARKAADRCRRLVAYRARRLGPGYGAALVKVIRSPKAAGFAACHSFPSWAESSLRPRTEVRLLSKINLSRAEARPLRQIAMAFHDLVPRPAQPHAPTHQLMSANLRIEGAHGTPCSGRISAARTSTA